MSLRRLAAALLLFLAAQARAAALVRRASGEASKAAGQAPAAGDALKTGHDGELVVDAGGATVRLAPESSATLVSFSDRASAWRVDSGLVEIWVATRPAAALALTTPMASAVCGGGVLRVGVDASGASVWDLWSGRKLRVRSKNGCSVKLAPDGHVNVDRRGVVSPLEYIPPDFPAPARP